MVIVAWKCHIDPLGSAQIIRDLVTQVTTEEPLVGWCPLWVTGRFMSPIWWDGWDGHLLATGYNCYPVDATCETQITMITTCKWSSAHAESSSFVFWTDTIQPELWPGITIWWKTSPKNEPRFFLPELPASRMRASNMLIEIQVSGLIKNCYSHHIKWH